MTADLTLELANEKGYFLESYMLGKNFFFWDATTVETQCEDPNLRDSVIQKAIAADIFTEEELEMLEDDLPAVSPVRSIDWDTLKKMIEYVKVYDKATAEERKSLDYVGKFGTLSASEINENGIPKLSLAKGYPRTRWWIEDMFNPAPAIRLEKFVRETAKNYKVDLKDLIITFVVED